MHARHRLPILICLLILCSCSTPPSGHEVPPSTTQPVAANSSSPAAADLSPSPEVDAPLVVDEAAPAVPPLDLSQYALTPIFTVAPELLQTAYLCNLNRIVFSRDGDLYLVGPDGSAENLTPFTSNSDDNEPVWSPSKCQVAFTSTIDGSSDIYVLDLACDPPALTRITFTGDNFQPTWSPDGSALAFASTRGSGVPHLWAVDVDNPALVSQLTQGGGGDTDPAWDPTSPRLAFARVLADGTQALFLVDVDQPETLGGGVDQLTTPRGVDKQPNWSPDGRRIAFASDRTEYATFEVYTLDPQGVEFRVAQITHSADGTDSTSPSFSPTGCRLTFQSNRDGTSKIYTAAVDLLDGEVAQVTAGDAFDSNPDWRGTIKVVTTVVEPVVIAP